MSYVIGDTYAPAIVNDDRSGLNDEDEELLEAFLSDLPTRTVLIMGEDLGFTRCQVSGLMSECHEYEELLPRVRGHLRIIRPHEIRLTGSTLDRFARSSARGTLVELQAWCLDQWDLDGYECFIYDQHGRVVETFGDTEISPGDCIDVDLWEL